MSFFTPRAYAFVALCLIGLIWVDCSEFVSIYMEFSRRFFRFLFD